MAIEVQTCIVNSLRNANSVCSSPEFSPDMNQIKDNQGTRQDLCSNISNALKKTYPWPCTRNRPIFGGAPRSDSYNPILDGFFSIPRCPRELQYFSSCSYSPAVRDDSRPASPACLQALARHHVCHLRFTTLRVIFPDGRGSQR